MDITDIALIPGADKLAEVTVGGIGNYAGSFLTVRIGNAERKGQGTRSTSGGRGHGNRSTSGGRGSRHSR